MSLRELHAYLLHHSPKHSVRVGCRVMVGWCRGDEIHRTAMTFLGMKTGRTGKNLGQLAMLACQDLVERGIFAQQGHGSR